MSNSNNNQINVPQAREAMDRFKIKSVAGSPQISSISFQMVKKMLPIRKTKYERNNRIAVGHVQTVEYIASILT